MTYINKYFRVLWGLNKEKVDPWRHSDMYNLQYEQHSEQTARSLLLGIFHIAQSREIPLLHSYDNPSILHETITFIWILAMWSTQQEVICMMIFVRNNKLICYIWLVLWSSPKHRVPMATNPQRNKYNVILETAGILHIFFLAKRSLNSDYGPLWINRFISINGSWTFQSDNEVYYLLQVPM